MNPDPAEEELRRFLAEAPSPRLLVAWSDYKKAKRLHHDLLNWFRTRFTEDFEKWPTWARGASLPMQRVLIGARKRLDGALELERQRKEKKTP